jgi:hypothetical protein
LLPGAEIDNARQDWIVISARDQDRVLPWDQVVKEETAFRIGGRLSFASGDAGSSQWLVVGCIQDLTL